METIKMFRENFNKTNTENWTALFARLAIAITIFPHGAQKLLGWFGGAGFEGAMTFMTQTQGLPWIIGFIFILIEFFGPVLLILGLETRLSAAVIFCAFIGVLFADTIHNGFFMNWGRVGGKGEGFEYFILLYGLLIISLIAGGGKASIDAALQKRKVRIATE